MAPSETPVAGKPEPKPAAPIPAAPIPAPPAVPVAPRTEQRGPAESASPAAMFNRQIFTVVSLLVAALLLLLVGNLWFQYQNYSVGIQLARESGGSVDSLSLILIYSRAWDFAVTKTSALFLSFLI